MAVVVKVCRTAKNPIGSEQAKEKGVGSLLTASANKAAVQGGIYPAQLADLLFGKRECLLRPRKGPPLCYRWGRSPV